MDTESEDLGSLIRLYALGDLEDDRIPMVEEYIRLNPQAREEVEEIQEIMAATAAEPLDEPSPELSVSTKEEVYSLIAERREHATISFGQLITGFFRKPAYATAAAVVIIGICAVLIFSLRGPSKPDTGIAERRDITTVGLAGTLEEEFSKYVARSAEIFEQVLVKDAAGIRELLDGHDITIDIGQAMKLLENEEIIQNPDYSSLVSDIEAVWRDLRKLVEEQKSGMAEEAGKKISEKNIIERAHSIGSAD